MKTTFIEIVIIVAILGILLIAIIPQYSDDKPCVCNNDLVQMLDDYTIEDR